MMLLQLLVSLNNLQHTNTTHTSTATRTVCMHITCIARHCSANYPMPRSSGDNNHHKTLRADEVACMKWFFASRFPLFLCLSFALFVSFFLIFFFLPCEIAHLDGGQMAQRAPKGASTPTSHLAAMPPPMLVCRKQSTSSTIPFLSSIISLSFSPVLLSFGLCSDTSAVSQPGN